MTRSALFLLLFAAAAALTGCSLPYYWQAVGGQIELLRKREPISRVLVDAGVSPEIKAALQNVSEVREFAVERLLLPSNGSYTTYVELERPYVVWNVVAADEFSVLPERWCFPFAGCVAYRGFFERESAERFQARLTRKGLDTYLGGASAYSTLGYFADPVLNTMLGGGEQYIASLVFHELAHQKLYVKDDSEFNEAFATAIEEYGTELWLRQRADHAALEQYHRRLRYRADFADLVLAQQARLTAAFAAAVPPEAKRLAKSQVFDQMRAEYAVLKEEWGGVSDYDAWFAQPLNNAVLASVATYRRWLPGMRSRLRDVGLTAFYAEMQTLGALDLGAREAELEAMLHRALVSHSAAQAR